MQCAEQASEGQVRRERAGNPSAHGCAACDLLLAKDLELCSAIPRACFRRAESASEC